MKLFKKEVDVVPEVVAPVSPTVPIGSPLTLKTLEADAIKEYEAVAATLDFAPAALLEEKFKRYLLDNAIHIYSLAKVSEFLTKSFDGRKWGWRPLREKDAEKKLWFTHLPSSANGNILSGKYQAAVPLPVLLTVKDIEENVPGLTFYVSDEDKRAVGDPFLMVAATGVQPYVIERWDEPTFRE